MSDTYYEWLTYYILYVCCGGVFGLCVFTCRITQPRRYGLLLFSAMFCWIAFGVHYSLTAASLDFATLVNLTPSQREAQQHLLWHTSFISYIVPALSMVVAGELLLDFLRTPTRHKHGA